MSNTSVIDLPHDRKVSYRFHPVSERVGDYPTLILHHSFATTLRLYDGCFANEEISQLCNILAVDAFGHGGSSMKEDDQAWTYWDTAQMSLDLMETLGITKAYVLGTSQGGFVAVRMALLQPQKVLGLILLGTSMFAESPETLELGCWDVKEGLGPLRSALQSMDPEPSFEPPASFLDAVISSGFGGCLSEDAVEFWKNSTKAVYDGVAGQKKLLGSTVCLMDRDGLEKRLREINVPVFVAHGTEDQVYSVAIAEKGQKAMTNSPRCELEIVEGGKHYLYASHPDRVHD
ncbi:alpha/beta-hydrolase, partial [Choiromyces venosus 120613-1]